jgi:hypothetical protein
MATTVQQAAVNALVEYLTEELEDVTVTGHWPDSEADLPELAITILLAGKRVDDATDARVVAIEGTGVNRTFTWIVKAATQGLQIDVWAKYDTSRDDLLARLDDLLHRGEAYTLPSGSIANGIGDPVRDGLLLALDPTSGHEGFADFTFDGPSLGDSAERVLRHEYRATITAEVSFVLTVKTTVPLLQIAGLRMRAGEVPAAVPRESYDVAPGDEE